MVILESKIPQLTCHHHASSHTTTISYNSHKKQTIQPNKIHDVDNKLLSKGVIKSYNISICSFRILFSFSPLLPSSLFFFFLANNMWYVILASTICYFCSFSFAFFCSPLIRFCILLLFWLFFSSVYLLTEIGLL